MKYLIAYRFENQEKDDFEDVVAAIERLDSKAIEVFLNTWIISSELTASMILADLTSYFGINDMLIVAKYSDVSVLNLKTHTFMSIMSL